MLKLLLGTAMFCYAPDGGEGSAGTGGQGAGSGEGTGAKGDPGTGGEGDKGAGGAATLAGFPNASAEDIAYIQSKGWDKSQNPTGDILKSYQNLEKVFGADKAGNTVMIPGEQADKKTLDTFFDRLGRPTAPDKYTAPKFEGMGDDLDKGLRETGHALGLSDKQLKGLADWNNSAAKVMNERLAAEGAKEVTTQTEALKKEWGATYDERIGVGKLAAKELGWTEDQVNGLQAVLGFDGVMKLAYNLGSKVGEGKFEVGDGGRGGGTAGAMTPNQAKLELSRLTTDAAFMKAWTDKNDVGHVAAVAKKSQLTVWASGSK